MIGKMIMTKIVKLSLFAVAAVLASTNAAADTASSSEAPLNTSETVRIVKTVATPQTTKAKPVIKVVRRAVPNTRRATRTVSGGIVIIAPETVTDNMNVYRPVTSKTKMPNLFKP